MESFYRTHLYLIKHLNTPVRRGLMDEINWDDRLIGITGTRGVGKTTFLLSYAKETFGEDRSCLYINLNNLYFTAHTLIEFADQFRRQGGQVLLIDQIFKYTNWANELRYCYNHFSDLKIVFTGSSVICFNEGQEALSDIVNSYFLRGFSFREYLNLKSGSTFPAFSLEEILANHQVLVKQILSKIKPSLYFQSYLHHGFYPFFLEKRNFSENLLKTVNMMIEVDILLIKQIELKYLYKIKQLLYLLAQSAPCTPNVSQLSSDIQTSRATIMKYIQYLKEARVVNMLYSQGEQSLKKPDKVYLHNTNLIYALQPGEIDKQTVRETFFINAIYKGHKINQGKKKFDFMVDDCYFFQMEKEKATKHSHPDLIYIKDTIETDDPQTIPLWLFGFLY